MGRGKRKGRNEVTVCKEEEDNKVKERVAYEDTQTLK